MSFLDDWSEWSTGKKVGSIAAGIVALCCIGLIVLSVLGGGASPDKNTSSSSSGDNSTDSEQEGLKVQNLTLKSGGYGSYDLTCKLIPDKDYRYLEVHITFYDSDEAVIDKSPLVWNMNDVKKNQTIKVSGSAYVQGDNKPTHAKVLFFDNSFSGDDSDAIYSEDVKI